MNAIDPVFGVEVPFERELVPPRYIMEKDMIQIGPVGCCCEIFPETGDPFLCYSLLLHK